MSIKKVTLKNGDTVEIYQSEGGNPRTEWDNFSHVILFGNYRHLGDKHDITLSDDFESRHDFIERGAEQVAKQFKDVAIILPVHVYEHSGIALSTSMSGQFGCRWDSGTAGFVVVTKEDIRENWGIKRVTQKHIDHARRLMIGEIEVLSHYANGDVYGYSIEDEEGNHIDSCGGFYGWDLKESGMADYLSEEAVELLS